MVTFREELTDLINRHSMENGSNTPDFLLAQFLCWCLEAFDMAVQRREFWYGRGECPLTVADDVAHRNLTEAPPDPP